MQTIRLDMKRFQYRLGQHWLPIWIFHAGFQAVLAYRIGHWIDFRRNMNNPLMWLLIPFLLIYERWTEITTGIYIHPHAQIGHSLYIPHFGGIVVGEAVIIGDYCDIYQGVTLGYGGMGDTGGYPTIADRVFLGAGAKILGQIHIHQDVIVGANAVVLKDIPARAIVGGSPAKVLSYKGSFLYILYNDMETDHDRLASLALVDDASS
ncbi:MAG: serine O-acetyltransferase [Chloroflexota bacterium]